MVAFHVLGLREALEDTRLVAGRLATGEVVVVQVVVAAGGQVVVVLLLLCAALAVP